MMPEMDGLETCRRLRDDPASETIPIIFITARSSKVDKLEGLDSGAIDYISKPIDLDETLARVRTQLRLAQMYRENIDLQRRLAETRESALIGRVAQGMVHNVNNLLGVVVGYLDLIGVTRNNPDRLESNLAAAHRAVDRMIELVQKLSSTSSDRLPKPVFLSLSEAIGNAVDRFIRDHAPPPGMIKVDLGGYSDAPIAIHTESFESVIGALLANAVESYPDLGGQSIRVDTSITPDGSGRSFLEVSITDEGCGIPEENIGQVFDPFFSTKRRVGRGMGLTIAKHSAKDLGGEVRLAPNPTGAGTRAIFRLPAIGEDALA